MKSSAHCVNSSDSSSISGNDPMGITPLTKFSKYSVTASIKAGASL